ncbi:MAG: hypothetical protein EA364_11355, partial [Balneolaceae bacterium]
MKIRTTTNIKDLAGDIIVPVVPSMAPFHQNQLLVDLTGGKHERLLKDLDAGKGEVSTAYGGD